MTRSRPLRKHYSSLSGLGRTVLMLWFESRLRLRRDSWFSRPPKTTFISERAPGCIMSVKINRLGHEPTQRISLKTTVTRLSNPGHYVTKTLTRSWRRRWKSSGKERDLTTSSGKIWRTRLAMRTLSSHAQRARSRRQTSCKLHALPTARSAATHTLVCALSQEG
jgi:hypothetical protein